MVVRPGIFPRDERGCRLIHRESSDKNEASGTREESPSPRLPAIQTLLTATWVPDTLRAAPALVARYTNLSY
jgi:hypothetical protein